MNVSQVGYARDISLGAIKDDATRAALREIVERIQKVQSAASGAINFNEITYQEGGAKPTPQEGQWIFWKDTLGAPGNPKGYLVTTQGSETLTIQTVETI